MNSAKDVYNYVYNDEKIREIYDKIDSNEEDNYDAWGHHNFNHVCNVRDIVEQILRELNYDDSFINEAKIAAIMHDIGALQGKPNHAERSYIYAMNYFNNNHIELEHNNQILNAIRNHSEGFDTDNIMQLALILADKLDIKKTRPTKRGLEVSGNRQYSNIEDVKTRIDNHILQVVFVANEKLDKKELEDYYFMQKVRNAIRSFADKLDLRYEIYLNEKIWNEMM